MNLQNGGMFYTTNTESTFILFGVDITYAADSGFFLKCTGNANQRGWGTAGNNGTDCLFTAIAQAMQGNVIWDSISQLDLYVLEGSTLTNLHCAGTIVDADGNTVTIIGIDGTFYVQGTSEFTITVDSYDNTVDTTAASTVDSWSDFAVAKP